MKWETKDKLKLKSPFVCAIIMMIVGIGTFFHECQRDVVKKRIGMASKAARVLLSKNAPVLTIVDNAGYHNW